MPSLGFYLAETLKHTFFVLWIKRRLCKKLPVGGGLCTWDGSSVTPRRRGLFRPGKRQVKFFSLRIRKSVHQPVGLV